MKNKQRRQELRKDIDTIEEEIKPVPERNLFDHKRLLAINKLETQIQENKLAEKNTIKEVLDLIDEWWIDFCSKVLDDGQDEEELLKELKQKIKQLK